ncbi:hypothetical protein HZY83_05830 [Gemella sp. GH3]|uniref:hypothetical protein n=1 Tax=unclassified Gemella TaxID=2624949 RepID=UPI0015D0AF5C|nr:MULTISPECIES: hypothetical protein [unclassified Gemella]MBF0714190.1 hypothetical protein [Gemella sp. GH3.1]NYS51142.1 hypothetical protein [Gemella sp. GH3]
MRDKKLVEQIAAFKTLPVGDNNWRLSFYHIAKEFWNLEEHYVVIDKQSYEREGYNLPLIIDYKGTYAVQFFTNYEKASLFVEKEKDNFIVNGKKLIYKMKKGAFQQVFAPFLAQQQLNYIINSAGEHFLDTFERLIAIMEADTDFIVDKDQEKLLKDSDYSGFYADVCNKYLIFLG